MAFPPIADRLTLERSERFDLSVTGPGAPWIAGVPAARNLVLRAAAALHIALGCDLVPATFTLHKELPVMGGIGGGSADAAAALRLLCRFWGVDIVDPRVAAVARGLGADVPMCLVSHSLRAGGTGEEVEPVALPAVGLLLVNPGVGIATPAVFAALKRRDNAGLPAPAFRDLADLLDFLSAARNDLEAPAIRLAPAIGTVLDMLRALPGARLARMSGSGATCFALFDDAASASRAAAALSAANPGWWARSSTLV